MVELFNYLAHLSSPTGAPKIVSVPYATHSPDSNIPEFSAWNCLHQVVTVIFMSLVQKSHRSSFKWSKTGETSSWVWSTMNPGNWKTSYLLLKNSRWGRCETECEATISALTFHIWLPDMWIKPQFHLWSRCLLMYTLQAANDGSSTWETWMRFLVHGQSWRFQAIWKNEWATEWFLHLSNRNK